MAERCGATSSYSRLKELESDRTWITAYAIDSSGESLRGFIPFYTTKAQTWVNSPYDPANWGLQPQSPSTSVVLGSVRDVRSTLSIAPGENVQSVLGGLLNAIESSVAQRKILLPHYAESDYQQLSECFGNRAKWSRTVVHCDFTGVDDRDWESKLSKIPRRERRRDREHIRSLGLKSYIRPWLDDDERYLGLIVQHAQRFGVEEHLGLVRRRYDRWRRCDDVVLLSNFGMRDEEILSFGTILQWRDQLILYEAGFPGDDGAQRLALYTLTLSEGPVAYARENGIRIIRLGFTTEGFKKRRGAALESHYYGQVLQN